MNVFRNLQEIDNDMELAQALEEEFSLSECPQMHSFDDMGNAQRIIEKFGNIIRYSYVDKSWLFYNGKYWEYDESGEIERLCDEMVNGMKNELALYGNPEDDTYKAFQKFMKKCRFHNNKKNMIKETQHLVPVAPSQLDKYKFLLNTPDGTIDLKSMKIYQHDSTKYLTKITAYGIEKADCPQWKKFLNDIFNGDEELVRYIQKAVGYSLTGLTSEQCAFFLYGTGRNGKSTFIEILRELAGSYSTNIQAETIMVRGKNNSGSASSDIARLKGARFVTSVEPNEGVVINEGLLKQLTGEDIVTARKLFANEFEFKPEFKLWMATNHKPKIRGTDTGIWRRIHLIPFTVQIPAKKIDVHLKDKLRTEMKVIMMWAVQGCMMYLNEGLEMPLAVKEAVKEYRQEMDIISTFIENCCIEDLSASVKASELYAVYARWATENNEFRMSNSKFGLEMSKRFEKSKNRNGIFYNGISLSDNSPYSISIG